MKKRIATLHCGTVKDQLNCSSLLCFDSYHNRKGAFERYDDDAELVGLLTCAGCPTGLGADKLYMKIKSLAENSRIDAIHMAGCMTLICPFKNKYAKMIEENFPDVELIIGTHAGDNPEQEAQQFKEICKAIINTPKMTVDDGANMMLGYIPPVVMSQENAN